MKMYIRFALIWAVNTILICLANFYYPQGYVLGNAVLTPVMAAVLTGFFLTLLLRIFATFKQKPKKSRYMMFGYYFLANSVLIWGLARLSVVTGFGIPAFYWAFYLGFFAVLAQWLTRQAFKGLKLAK